MAANYHVYTGEVFNQHWHTIAKTRDYFDLEKARERILALAKKHHSQYYVIRDCHDSIWGQRVDNIDAHWPPSAEVSDSVYGGEK